MIRNTKHRCWLAGAWALNCLYCLLCSACFVVMCLPVGTGRAGEVGLSGGSRQGGNCAPLCSVQRATRPLCLSLTELSLPSPIWVWKNRLRPPLLCARQPSASLPCRSPRGVVGPSASSSRRWNYRAGAQLRCAGCCVLAPCDARHEIWDDGYTSKIVTVRHKAVARTPMTSPSNLPS